MNAKTRRTLLEFGIAVDAAVIATGFAYFLPHQPVFTCTSLLLAVALVDWFRGVRAGLAAAGFSVVALLLVFNNVVDAKQIVLFGLTSAATCIAVELIRGWTGGQAFKPVKGVDRRLGGRAVLPILRYAALPILALVIYTNVSDVAMRNFAIPSLLQPLILILGVAVWHYRRRLGTAAIVAQPLTLALAAYCAVLFVSSVWAADVRLADERIVDGVKNLAIFLIAATLAASWRALKTVIAVLAIAASALSIVTIHQTVAHDYTHEYFGFARIQIAHLYGDVIELRPAGPVGDPNFYAQFLLMIVPLALFGAFAAERPLRRALLLIAAAIITAGTILTYSRGAMLALAVVALLTLLALRIRPKQIAMLAAIGVVVLLLLPSEVTRRALTIESLMPGADAKVDSSIVKRKLLLATALRMFDDHVLLGVGAGNFTKSFTRYANEVGSPAPQYDEPGERQFPHTLYLEIAAETGIVGLLTFGAAVAFALASLWRARKTLLACQATGRAGIVTGLGIALIGYLITSVFLHGSFMRYLWLLFALIAAVTRLADESHPALAEEQSAPRLAVAPEVAS